MLQNLLSFTTVVQNQKPGCEMAAVAVLSTGPVTDLDACRDDVRDFLGMLSWPIAAVEVRL